MNKGRRCGPRTTVPDDRRTMNRCNGKIIGNHLGIPDDQQIKLGCLKGEWGGDEKDLVLLR